MTIEKKPKINHGFYKQCQMFWILSYLTRFKKIDKKETLKRIEDYLETFLWHPPLMKRLLKLKEDVNTKGGIKYEAQNKEDSGELRSAS